MSSKKKNAITMIALVVVLIICLVLYFVIPRGKSSDKDADSSSTSESNSTDSGSDNAKITLDTITSDNISSITLTKKGKQAWKLSQKKKGTWKIDGKESAPVSDDTISSMVKNVNPVKATQKFSAKSGNLSDYGLKTPAFTIAILAGIESLLSAVVSDGMIGDTHKSNAELIGQGLGNIFSGLFGGIPATGAIARTAANVRNGGRTPIAGIVHCITLTIILLVLMPLAALIPMTTLAAVLLVVAANMADWTSFFRLCKTAPKSDIIVLVATFFLTVFFDLVVAIEIGVVLAALLFMKRMAETADIKAWKYTDSPDITPGEAEKLRDIPHSISVFEICGPMFFAAADQIVNINSHHHTKVVVIRMRSVPAIDASAMHSLHELADRAKRKNITLVFSHVNEQPMHVMEKDGFVELIGKENFHENIVDALDYAEQLVR